MVIEKLNLSKEKLEKAAYILKTVAHPTRLAVLQLLAETGPLPVNEISEQINCEQSLLSHHLINMKLKGILASSKEGLHVFYSLKQTEIIKLLVCVENCDCNM
jgi:DNA-binding transcriptional ArsR family regulator